MKIGVIKKFYFDFLTFLKGEGFFNDNNIMIYKFDNFNEVEIALKSGFLDIALSSNALLLEDSDYFDQIIFIKNAFKIFGYQNFKEKITGEREILKVAIPQKSINFKKYFYSFYKFFCGKSEKIQWIQTDYEDLDILFERNFIDFAIVYEPLTFDIISKRFASLLVHKNKNEIPLSFVYPKDLIDNEKIKNFNNAVSNIRKSLIETNLLDKFLSVEGSKCLCLKNYSSIFLQSFSFDQSHNKNSTDAKNKVNDLKDAKISKLGKYNNYVSYYGDEFTSLFQKEINKIIHYGMDQLNECNDTTIYELNLIKKLIENLKNKEKINKLKILALKEKNSTLLEDLANRQQVLSDLFMQFKTTSENLIIKNIQVEQTIKDKDRLIAVISHDLKTPLSGILAISEQLLENENNEEKKKKLYIINESGNTLLMLINNLLESAKNESLSKKLEEKIFDIKKIIESISSNIEEKIKNKNIEFKLIYNNSIPQILYGDPMKLNQIIYNLLGNSAKFTQKGFIELKVDLLEKDQDFCKLLFQVKDTGIGISEDKIEHIFDPFVQE
ncbi:MAG: sensor histidine kinase, partial [Exilispira sp.]